MEFQDTSTGLSETYSINLHLILDSAQTFLRASLGEVLD